MRAGLAAAVRLYGTLLYLYPSSFRRAYGDDMVQVFRTSCRIAMERGSRRSLPALWLRSLRDLVVSATAERVATLRESGRLQYVSLYLAAIVLAAATGYVHVHGDADRTAVVFLLLGSFLCAMAVPERASRLALILGCGIPGMLLLCQALGVPGAAERDVDLPLPLPFVPALIGAYTGVLTRWAITHLWSLTPLARRA